MVEGFLDNYKLVLEESMDLYDWEVFRKRCMDKLEQQDWEEDLIIDFFDDHIIPEAMMYESYLLNEPEMNHYPLIGEEYVNKS